MSPDRQEQEREILYRVDERTERMDARMERIHEGVAQNAELLDTHDDKIQRNTTILNSITFGLGSLLTAGVAKFMGLFTIKPP